MAAASAVPEGASSDNLDQYSAASSDVSSLQLVDSRSEADYYDLWGLIRPYLYLFSLKSFSF